ncbi:MAG: hypothetical protein ACLUVC_10045 [Longibaculum sp.]
MKKLLKGSLLFCFALICISYIAYFFQQQTFPYTYQKTIDNFFGKCQIAKDNGYSNDKSTRFDKVNHWKITPTNVNQDFVINDQLQFFSQLQYIYVNQYEKDLKQKLGNENIYISLRNAYDPFLPDTIIEEGYPNGDQQIYENYDKMYPNQFKISDHQDITQLFEEKSIPLYFIMVCDDKNIAEKFVNEVKNVNAIIKIVPSKTNINSPDIDHAILQSDDDSYMFVYQGKPIQDAYHIMSQKTQEKQQYKAIENNTILYNYNQYIKEHIKF